MCNMCFSILDLALAKYSLLHGSNVKRHESGSSCLFWIFSLRRDFSTEVRKNILPYEVITLSASHYLCALERKCVQGSQRESLRKHLGAFLRCLRGDNVQPGRRDVEETGGCRGTPRVGRNQQKTGTKTMPSPKLPEARYHLLELEKAS